MSAERPRVFQSGTLTVVFGGDGRSVYAGGTFLTMARGVVTDTLGTPKVVFRRPNNGPEERDLDEETRAVRAGKHEFIRE